MLSCLTRPWEAGLMSLSLVAAVSLWVPEEPAPFQQLLCHSWRESKPAWAVMGLLLARELPSRHLPLRSCHGSAAAVPTG